MEVKRSIILIFLFILIVNIVNGVDYYVSSDGIASWSECTNIDTSCSLSTANNNLRAGDTVYLRGGVYEQGIQPADSGRPGERIVYSNYDDEEVTITNIGMGIRLISKSYITINGVDFQNIDRYVIIEDGSYNHIGYCSFGPMRNYVNWRGIYLSRSASYNWIHHCTISQYGYFSDNQDWGDMIMIGMSEHAESIGANHNLIEDNVLYYGGHNLLAVNDRYNVIRNNYFHNEPWYDLNSKKWGNRDIASEDGADILGEVQEGWNLIEGNRFGPTGIPTDDSFADSFQLASSDFIIRYNMFYESQGPGLRFTRYPDSKYCVNNHAYNNVFYHNGIVTENDWKAGVAFLSFTSEGALRDNVLKNNIFYRNIGGSYYYYGGVSSGDQIFKSNWEEEGDPLFVDESPLDPFNPDLPDFRLQETSPCIDTGTYLTTVADSDIGSGAILRVKDANYFQDGWSIEQVEADWIAVGDVGNVVQVDSINYDANEIILKNSITRNIGDEVWLYRDSSGRRVLYGEAPDIGAYEYGGITLIGDVDLDDDVDLQDLILVAIIFGKEEGELDFNGNADLDGSGVIDLPDLIIVAIHFGKGS